MFTKRHRRAALAAVTAASAYLAASELAGRRPVRVGALWLVSSVAVAGVIGAGANSRLAVQHRALRNRFDGLLNNGGTFAGPIYATQVNPQGTHRANFSWTANTHLGGSGTTWENGAQARINDLIDQLSNVSDRCDFLNTQLINAGVAVN